MQAPGHSPATCGPRDGSAGAGRETDDVRGARDGSTRWAASAHEGERGGWDGRKQGTTGVAGQVAAAAATAGTTEHVGARWVRRRRTTARSRLRGAVRTLSPRARQAAALRLPGGRPMVETDRGGRSIGGRSSTEGGGLGAATRRESEWARGVATADGGNAPPGQGQEVSPPPPSRPHTTTPSPHHISTTHTTLAASLLLVAFTVRVL